MVATRPAARSRVSDGHLRPQPALIVLPMRICLAQLDAALGDLAANARAAAGATAQGCADGADLVVFPELALCGYSLAGVETETTTSEEELRAIAGDGSALLCYREPAAGRTFNSAAYLEGGRIVHVHRKIQLVGYPPFGESALFAPGEELRAFTTALGRFAVLICNDAWQPALAPLAAADGAAVLLMPAASSTAVPEAEPYWHGLTRFYARMLACYVVFVNRVGSERGLDFWGGSHVVGPDGEIVAQAPRLEPSLTHAEIDLGAVARRRAALRLPTELRPELLREELARLAAGAP
jgi:predicted amidohydrolase